MLVGVLMAGAMVGVVLWTNERRADDDRECSLGSVPYPSQSDCDVVALWWTLGLSAIAGAIAIAAFVGATKVHRVVKI